MKQKLMLFGLMLLLVISGCKKDMPQESATNSDQLQDKPGAPDDRFRQCRLIFDDRDGVYGNFFQYNRNGLVEKWKIDYYDGFPDEYSFTYDNRNRLKTGNVVFNYNGHSFTVAYLYQGDRLVRETWYAAGTTNVADDIVNTYNFRGQIIKRKSVTKNIYCTFTYDFLGNNPLVNFYIDDVLYLREEYSHRRFNRNPLTSLNGIPVILPYYDFVISNWWETSQKWTIYEDGVPNVIVDMDPNTVQMELGPQLFLTSVTNFDRAIQQNTTAVFEYENCNGANKPTAARTITKNNNPRAQLISKLKRALLPGHSKNIKNEIKELVKKLNQL